MPPTLIIDDEVQPIIKLFSAVKNKDLARIPRQRQYESREVFKPNTWLIDLVQFYAAGSPIWFIFFVNANSRYLIVREGSASMLTMDAVELPENIRSRVKTDAFIPIIEKIHKDYNIQYLIGDGEKAFWSNQAMRFYNRNNITPFPLNVKRDGHLRMAILDRIVRTIREMAENAEITDFTPKVLKQLAVVYNNTKHTTLTNALKNNVIFKINNITGITPSDMFHNPTLERLFISIVRQKNQKQQQKVKNFVIPNGTKVKVKNTRGIWTVLNHRGKSYNVVASNGKKRNIARCYITIHKQGHT